MSSELNNFISILQAISSIGYGLDNLSSSLNSSAIFNG